MKLGVVLLECLAIFGPVCFTEFCPVKTNKEELDIYEVQRRFSQFANNMSSPLKLVLSNPQNDRGVRHEYTITLCQDKNVSAVTDVFQKNGTPITRNLGSTENATLIGGVDWFMVSYEDGDDCAQGWNHETVLMVICAVDQEVPELRIVEQFQITKTPGAEACHVMFEINHPSACTKPAESRPVSPPKQKAITLSIGSRIMITAISIVLLYLILGGAYNFVVLNQVGYNLVPNRTFWKKIGNLSSDGYDTLFRFEKATGPQYQGLTEALDFETDTPRMARA